MESITPEGNIRSGFPILEQMGVMTAWGKVLVEPKNGIKEMMMKVPNQTSNV